MENGRLKQALLASTKSLEQIEAEQQQVSEFDVRLAGVWNRFGAYCDAVSSGEVNAPKTIRQSVARHIRDMGRVDDPDFPYRFDEKLARRACEWFPRHVRHSIGADAGAAFFLSDWQVFMTGLLFGWVEKDGGARRFRKLFLTIARKNGKSTWVSGLVILLGCDDINPVTKGIEQVAQIVLCATKVEQSAKVVFAECVRMVKQSPEIECKTTYNKTKKLLTFEDTDGHITPIASDRAFSGLNPAVIGIDEYHEFDARHQEFIDTMISSQGSKTQGLYLVTTTAGTDRSFLYLELYEYCKRVLREEIHDERQLALIYEIDEDADIYDESNWIQSNPNIDISVKRDFLQQMAGEAKTGGFLSRNRFQRFHANQTVEANDRAFDMSDWGNAGGTLSDWSLADAVGGGLDLGARDDFASFSLCARFPVEENLFRYELRSWSYVLTDTPRDLTKLPFPEWIENGWLRVSDTPVTDLENDLVEACYKFNVYAVAFDPSQAQATSETLRTEGITAGRMQQSHYMFHEPITDLMSSLRAGRLIHDGNPILTWAAGNAILVQDRKQKVMFDKHQSKDKIDAIVSATMAYRMAMVAPSQSTDVSMGEEPVSAGPMTAKDAVEIYARGIFDDL